MRVSKNEESGRYEVVVEGDTYEFEKFGALSSIDWLMTIGSVVGGPLGEAVSVMFGQGGKGLATQLSGDFSRNVVKELASRFRTDKKLILDILQKLAAWRVLANGKPIDFDKYYEDRLHLVLEVARANLEVQYGPSYAAAIVRYSGPPASAETPLASST